MIDFTTLIERVSATTQPWADLYADHAALSTGVIAAHILAMFVGGGMAIAADRAILRSRPGTAEAVRAVVADLSTTHSVVLGSLTVTVITGLALLASDVGNFAVSWVFWTKMGSFAILLANGLRMQRVEKTVMTSLENIPIRTAEMPVPFPKQAWGGIRSAAAVSLSMWLTIVLLGVVLTNA